MNFGVGHVQSDSFFYDHKYVALTKINFLVSNEDLVKRSCLYSNDKMPLENILLGKIHRIHLNLDSDILLYMYHYHCQSIP